MSTLREDIDNAIKKDCGKPLLLTVLVWVTEDGELFVKYAGDQIPGMQEAILQRFPKIIADALGGRLVPKLHAGGHEN